MLSSSVQGQRIFEQVAHDLQNAGGQRNSYQLFALALDPQRRPVLGRTEKHADFLIRAEDFGVPQTRHRVILVGLRNDAASRLASSMLTNGAAEDEPATVRHVVDFMPRIRSTLTKGDSDEAWREAVLGQMVLAIKAIESLKDAGDILDIANQADHGFLSSNESLPRSSTDEAPLAPGCPTALADWITDDHLTVTLNHQSRAHMPDDFSRYLFCSAFAKARFRSPRGARVSVDARPRPQKLVGADIPGPLPDPGVGRALDDRDQSHLQGRPLLHPSRPVSVPVDDGARGGALAVLPRQLFLHGNRTQQYVQVGNAVPPFLARQIAEVVWRSLEPVKQRRDLGSQRRIREPVLL